ncbi:unnamed protein product [Moneuplotes crassus]|uniref:Uncharacterized protein n=1 Tax=Euplotes crassus TaxID=5936 RepID=A0AAD1XM27_EUPCR|nr:unnamed protein product [Moneuplotes crassus]
MKDEEVDIERIHKSKVKKNKKRKKSKTKRKNKGKKKGQDMRDDTTGADSMKEIYNPEDDPESIVHYMPQEPVQKDTMDDPDNLKLVLKGRELAILLDGDIRSQPWTLTNNESGVELYSLPQDSKSEFRMKRVFTVDKPISYCAMTIQDFQTKLDVFPKLKEIKVIKDLGNQSQILYQKLRGNFNISQRDMVICNSEIQLTNGSVAIIGYCTKDHGEKFRKPIEASSCSDLVLLQPNLNDQTLITNIQYLDIGGNLSSTEVTNLSKGFHTQYTILKQTLEE